MICFMERKKAEKRRPARRWMAWFFLSGFVFAAGAEFNAPFFWRAQKDKKTIFILGTFQPGVDWRDIPCSGEILSRLQEADVLFADSGPEIYNQAVEQMIRENESLPRRQTGLHGIISSTGWEFQRLSAESRKFLEEKYSYIQSIDGLTLEPRLENMNHAGFVSVLRYSCLAENGPLFERFAGEMGELEGAFVSFQQKLHSHGPVPGYLDEVEDIVKILKKETLASGSYFAPGESIDEIIKNYETNCSPERVKAGFEEFARTLSLWIKRYKSGEEIKQYEDIKRLKESGFPEILMLSVESRFSKVPTKDRNNRWAEKIIRSAENHGRVFVAADIFHFTGDSGILSILREKGFTVARFDSKCFARAPAYTDHL